MRKTVGHGKPLEFDIKSLFWDGAAGTWFWVDPTNDLVFVGMIQRRSSPDNHPLLYRMHALVDQALVDPSK